MSIKISNRLLLVMLLLVSFLVRFYRLDSYPALNPDEAALGYNAYSLLLTGKDEHGASWPLHFKSFGDFKPGGYVYLALPFVQTFGLTPFAVRLPNLLFSLLAVYFVYRLILLLSDNNRLALISALIFSLSPWHIHFSRGAWESQTAFSLLIIGSYFFFSYTRRVRPLSLYLFIFSFVLSLYVYHSARIIAPILALIYFIFYLKPLTVNKVHFSRSMLMAVALTLPVLISFLQSGGAARFGGVGLTADPGPKARAEELLNHHQADLDLSDRLLHNFRLEYGFSWLDNYLSHFNLNFLFLSGDEVPRSKVPQMGQLLLLTLPLLFLGFYSLSQNRDLRFLIVSWLLVSPLAASLTFQTPSALRSLPLCLPLTLLISLGTVRLISSLPRLTVPVFFLILVNFIFYLDAYFVHYQKRYPFSWNMGTQQLVSYLNSNARTYDQVYITNVYDQPYILYLFFSQYPPARLHPQIKLTPPDRFGFSTVSSIDNIYFGIPGWDQIPPNSLIAAAPQEFSSQTPLSSISYVNFPPTFKIYLK